MTGPWGWAADAMIASALLMALVLVLRAPIRRMFGPQVAYMLWALPLVRLALPRLPGTWHPLAPTPIGHAGEALVLIVRPSVAVAPLPAADPMAIAGAVCGVWLVGAAAFLLFHIVAHHRFCRRIVAEAVCVETVDGIRIVISRAAAGPLAFGILHRYVAFPIDVADRYDADERALALAHEIGHHRRGDLIANWAALAVLALHWFDPLAWRAFRAFRADQERANDARVLAGRSAGDRHVYARAIVKAAHGGAVSAACHLHSITDLKGRLKMLARLPISRRRLASGAAAVASLLVAGLGLTASGSSAAAISEGVQDAVAQVAAAPVPPAPPAPEPIAVTPAVAARPTHGTHVVQRVLVTRDGKTTVHDDYTSADIDAHIAAGDRVAISPAEPGGSRMIVKMPDDPTTLVEIQDIPAVSSAKCGIGTGTPASMVLESSKGPARRIVVCTDRIRKVTADAMVTAGNTKDIERNAYAQALSGLLDARTKVVADAGMTSSGRAEALTAIDRSIAEIRDQSARFH